MTVDDPLFQPLKLGALEARHRIFMAPLTRNRASPEGVPSPMAPEYYGQRAHAGLIITEATQITPEGKGYINTPGIHAPEQVAAWRKITEAVHAHGGLAALQLWHVGRISHTSLQPNGQPPVAPSAIRAQAKTFTMAGFEDVSEPRALELSEIPRVVADYAAAARNAKEAGFDMVEVHAANGYLIDQFLQSNSNRRTDAYGGPVENRVRFLKEVVGAVADAFGADRVGVRLSPTGTFSDMADANREETFGTAYQALNAFGLAYLHVVERFAGSGNDEAEQLLARLRPLWKGVYIANGDYSAEGAREVIRSGRADAVAFGRAYIANPDLAARIRKGAPWNEPDQSTFYGGDHRGYTDYPTLEDSAA